MCMNPVWIITKYCCTIHNIVRQCFQNRTFRKNSMSLLKYLSIKAFNGLKDNSNSKMKTDSASPSTVFECSASYYNPAEKKWEAGCFTITKNYVQFICSSRKDEQFHLCLPLSTISSLEKRQSNFIYPSLVICVGSEKHWFGSFSSRDAVYNLLELFWRESLISKPHRKCSPPKISKTRSSLGKEILEMLCESKNTLIGAANALSDHSRQLYEAEEAVEDIHNDLTTAEEAVKSLSSPLAFVNFMNKDNEDTKVMPSHRYKVTFSFSNSENERDWEKGVLVISNDVILLNKEEETIMQVTKHELDVIQVLSPWELCVIHTFSGVKKSCYFMCPQLSRLLKFILSIPHYQEKIVYTDEDSSVYDTASNYSSSSVGSAADSSSSSGSSKSPKNVELLSDQALKNSSVISNKESSSPGSSKLPKNVELLSDQASKNSSTISDEEIEEINNVLQNLQTLAAEVSREQENQLERINSLVENVEKADIRMKKSSTSAKKIA